MRRRELGVIHDYGALRILSVRLEKFVGLFRAMLLDTVAVQIDQMQSSEPAP